MLLNNAKAEIDFAQPMYESLSPEALDLLRRMLAVDPEQRPSIEEVATHPFFSDPVLQNTDVSISLEFSYPYIPTILAATSLAELDNASSAL